MAILLRWPVSDPSPGLTWNLRRDRFEINGSGISLASGQIGQMGDWTFSPHMLVDCSENCGTPGWYELHSLFFNEQTNQVCFGILYLYSNTPNQVTLDHSTCFPELYESINQTFHASWTKS